MAGAVGISLDAAREGLQRSGLEDRWVDISIADYLFLTSRRPSKVRIAYQKALASAPDFYFDSARTQLEIFRTLGVFPEKTQTTLAVFQPPGTSQEPKLSSPYLARSSEMPRWLSTRKGYTSWQRANLSLIHEALALNADNFTLLALWDESRRKGSEARIICEWWRNNIAPP